ncbi:MAG: hypothetical protein A2W98_07705 [Bacteroidetes bacterium GWF2_33_38]|nr:MAG: hypothetical protein A2W98_07705 [Bacteroidetes bacterium GWF2_33_38]
MFQFVAFSQPKIKFTNYTYDFGTVNKFIPKPGIFELVNEGDSKLILMTTAMPQNIIVSLPNHFIEPEKKDTIYVAFEPKEVGFFKEYIPIISNANDEPIILTVIGYVESIIECPNVENNSAKQEFFFDILVIDKLTKEPIPNAEVVLRYSKQKFFRNFTDRKGEIKQKVESGTCLISANKKTYNSYQMDYHSIKRNEIIVIELERDANAQRKNNSIFKQPDNTDLERKSQTINNQNEKQDSNISKKIVDLPDFDDEGLLSKEKFNSNNIVFLIDVSASMRPSSKLHNLKMSMIDLVNIFRNTDQISLITYAKEPKVLFQVISGDKKDDIINCVDSLYADGGTYGLVGIAKAYEIALRNFINGGNNQVIVATDGEFNSPDYTEKDLIQLIRGNSQMNIKLSVIGFGNNPQANKTMRHMVKYGNGSFLNINEKNKLHELLIEEIKKNSLKTFF